MEKLSYLQNSFLSSGYQMFQFYYVKNGHVKFFKKNNNND